MEKDHSYFMKKAFEEAEYAFFKNEVPVGCVIVNNNDIISRSSNMVELLNDSTAHAELIAITSAQNSLNSKNLDNCILIYNPRALYNVLWSNLLVKDQYSCLCNLR